MASSAGHSKLNPHRAGQPAPTAPMFYLIGRQRLNPRALLLAVIAAFAALSLVLYALGHTRQEHSATEKNDPNQVDTVVLGGPQDAPRPARPDDHPTDVHPTILVHLPRWGEQTGMIPNSPAGQLLYNWLAAFNKANAPALEDSLPTIAPAAAAAAQMELRQQTGGFALLSAKEVMPGVIVFRLRDQTPSGVEVLGTLQMRAHSNPPSIESFSLRSVPAFAVQTGRNESTK